MSGVTDNKTMATALGYTGVASDVITPAVIHGAHGHLGRGIGAAALRAGTPLLGAFVGAIVGGVVFEAAFKGQDDGSFGSGFAALGALAFGGLLGFGAGVVTASAIDAGLLARDDAPPPAPARPAPAAAVVRPVVAPSANGVSAGLAGTF
jgi:hypothetical protein